MLISSVVSTSSVGWLTAPVIMGLLVVLSIGLYVLYTMSLYRIVCNSHMVVDAKDDNSRINARSFAVMPGINLFVLPVLVSNDVHKPFRGLTGVFFLASMVGLLTGGLPIEYAIFVPISIFLYSFYFTAKRYSKIPMLHSLLSLITIGVSIPFQLFAFRNRPLIIRDK